MPISWNNHLVGFYMEAYYSKGALNFLWSIIVPPVVFYVGFYLEEVLDFYFNNGEWYFAAPISDALAFNLLVLFILFLLNFVNCAVLWLWHWLGLKIVTFKWCLLESVLFISLYYGQMLLFRVLPYEVTHYQYFYIDSTAITDSTPIWLTRVWFASDATIAYCYILITLLLVMRKWAITR